MKKIIALLTIISVLLFTAVKVNAEEVDENSTSSTTAENETKVETIKIILDNTEPKVLVNNEEPNLEDITIEEQPSELQVWFEKNLGWVVGIPTGMVTTIISIALFVHKTKKKFDELNEDTSSQNKNTKAHLKATVELVAEAKKQNEIISNKIDSFIENNASQIAALTSALETMTKAYEASTRKIAALEEVIEMMALHTKELVANGTAEKITQKIRG